MVSDIITLATKCPMCAQPVTSIGITPHKSDQRNIWVGFRHGGRNKNQCEIVVNILLLADLINPDNMP